MNLLETNDLYNPQENGKIVLPEDLEEGKYYGLAFFNGKSKEVFAGGMTKEKLIDTVNKKEKNFPEMDIKAFYLEYNSPLKNKFNWDSPQRA